MRKRLRRINSYEKPKTVKQQVKFPYKRVRIDWIDIITEGGWGSEREFKNMKLSLYLMTCMIALSMVMPIVKRL